MYWSGYSTERKLHSQNFTPYPLKVLLCGLAADRWNQMSLRSWEDTSL